MFLKFPTFNTENYLSFLLKIRNVTNFIQKYGSLAHFLSFNKIVYSRKIYLIFYAECR